MKGLVFAAALLAAAPAPAQVRALILAGDGARDWARSTAALRQALLDSGRFAVRVNEEPAGFSAAALAGYDVLVLDGIGSQFPAATRRGIEEFVKGGKGLVTVQEAAYTFPEWQGPPPTPGPLRCTAVRFAPGDNPIARGLGESFLTCDRFFAGLRLQPAARVVATAQDQPAVWTSEYGKGRVFSMALGRETAARLESQFATAFARGAEWAATGRVTLSRVIGPRYDADRVRVRLVTGGHAYESSFYRIFENDPRIRAYVDPHPGAYQYPMKGTDVIVLYDSDFEISPRQQKNLQEFLESGHGVVAMHHAIADYPQWRWWWEEVIGGAWSREGHPKPTWKHNVSMIAEPVGEHPITAGIGPIHLVDETYKLSWISPRVKAIVRTGDPSADGPLVWVSPYQKSRVCYIQPGHGPGTHLNPRFQALVKQAIFWAAGQPRRAMEE